MATTRESGIAHEAAWPYVKASSVAFGACLIAATIWSVVVVEAVQSNIAGLGSAAGRFSYGHTIGGTRIV